MRILITGSSGQIGTNLALRLQREGHYVFGVDIRPNTWTQNFDTLLQDLSYPFKDFRHGIGAARYPTDLDAVVHFAANAKVYQLVQEPHRALDNIFMTFNVLEFCRNQNIPIIFSSSREVYGDIHRYITGEKSADFAATESPYSASKISGEALIYSYAKCYDLKYIVFRFSNVYGRYDNDLERMERVIPLFINKIANGEMVTVYGENKILDFTYIDDCVDGIVKGIYHLVGGQVTNHTINLAYGEGNTLVSVVEYIGEALNIKPQLRLQPSRVGEVTHYVADIRQACDLLGYKPSTPLREGIHKAVVWSMNKRS
jgi:UDP-glucose 4-epimerase